MVRVLPAMAAQGTWKVFPLDIKSAFLHGELKKKKFIQQPKDL